MGETPLQDFNSELFETFLISCEFAGMNTMFEYKYIRVKIHENIDCIRGRPIIGADIKHFYDYRYRPFSKQICQ